MLLKVEPPDGWSSQDGRVLFDAEREAERFAAMARLAFSLAIACVMLALSMIVGRWNDWVAVIAGANIALSALGAVLARASVFPRLLPWLGVFADALLLFGIGWFGPWIETLSAGMRSALVSPWGAFLLLAITSLGLNAWRLFVQALLFVLAIGLFIWWPSPGGQAVTIDPRLQLPFSDGSNATRLAIVLLTGLAMALAASRARKTLMLAIRTARERAVLERFNGFSATNATNSLSSAMPSMSASGCRPPPGNSAHRSWFRPRPSTTPGSPAQTDGQGMRASVCVGAARPSTPMPIMRQAELRWNPPGPDRRQAGP
ncbi:hypothetical protein [Ensifer sp.]|uniref:hypothetical protein n=1 Tax=Ensifer sp. TaxID=1872086 RepID=UPI002E132D3E|nr:hypothetical protein [Ensifer sp.]